MPALKIERVRVCITLLTTRSGMNKSEPITMDNLKPRQEEAVAATVGAIQTTMGIVELVRS